MVWIPLVLKAAPLIGLRRGQEGNEGLRLFCLWARDTGRQGKEGRGPRAAEDPGNNCQGWASGEHDGTRQVGYLYEVPWVLRGQEAREADRTWTQPERHLPVRRGRRAREEESGSFRVRPHVFRL